MKNFVGGTLNFLANFQIAGKWPTQPFTSENIFRDLNAPNSVYEYDATLSMENE